MKNTPNEEFNIDNPHNFKTPNIIRSSQQNHNNNGKPSNIMEKLQATPKQNFTAIGNNPPEPISYFEGGKNMVYSTIYDEKSNGNGEISKDYDKFSNIDIDIASPSSSQSGGNTYQNSNSNQSSGKMSLKDGLKENLDEYINSISSEYKHFKSNHVSIDTPTNKANSNGVYQTNHRILKTIEKYFFVDEASFSIKSEFLEQKLPNIEKVIRNGIEKCGTIEIEGGVILAHSNKIEKHLKKNMTPINTNVSLGYDKIQYWKHLQSQGKSKVLDNSTLLLKKELKRKNVKAIHNLLTKIKKLKDIIDGLKIGTTDTKKNKISFDLIVKSKEILSNFKRAHKINYYIIDLFDNELEKYLSKCYSQINQGIENTLKHYFVNYIRYNASGMNTETTFIIPKYVYNKLSSSSKGAKVLLSSIETCANDGINKDISNQIIFVKDAYLKNNMMNEFINKMSSGFITVLNSVYEGLYDKFLSDLDRINSDKQEEMNTNNTLLNQITVVIDKEKNEQVILGILIHVNKLFLAAGNQLCENAFDNNNIHPIKLITEGNSKKLVINDIIQKQAIKCLNEALSHSNFETFIDNYYIIDNILSTGGSELVNGLSTTLIKCQKEHVNIWVNNKIAKINSSGYKNWEEIKEIPGSYQNILTIFTTFNIGDNYISHEKHLKSQGYPMEMISFFPDLESKFQSIEQVNYISISKATGKCNQCSLDIIKSSYELGKFFCGFDKNIWDCILSSYINLLKVYLTYQKEQIIQGKLNGVTQQEITMTNSIAELVKEIRYCGIKSDGYKLIAPTGCKGTVDKLYELNDLIESIVHNCKCKIIDLMDKHCICKVLIELNTIKLPHYNVIGGDIPVNNYTIIFVRLMKSIYESMGNAFDKDFITKTVNNALNKFFEHFERFIFNGEKIEEESCGKQFKRDMIFLKKNLNFGTMIDFDVVKNRIDSVNKKVLPDTLMKGGK